MPVNAADNTLLLPVATLIKHKQSLAVKCWRRRQERWCRLAVACLCLQRSQWSEILLAHAASRTNVKGRMVKVRRCGQA